MLDWIARKIGRFLGLVALEMRSVQTERKWVPPTRKLAAAEPQTRVA